MWKLVFSVVMLLLMCDGLAVAGDVALAHKLLNDLTPTEEYTARDLLTEMKLNSDAGFTEGDAELLVWVEKLRLGCRGFQWRLDSRPGWAKRLEHLGMVLPGQTWDDARKVAQYNAASARSLEAVGIDPSLLEIARPILWVLVLVALVFGWATAKVAHHRGYGGGNGFVAGFLFGILGLLTYGFLPDRNAEAELVHIGELLRDQREELRALSSMGRQASVSEQDGEE